MLTIEKISSYIPTTRFSLGTLLKEAGLSKEMLSVFSLVYGLRTIPIAIGKTHNFLINMAVSQLFLQSNFIPGIDYIIYVHTTPVLTPYGFRDFDFLKHIPSLRHACFFSMSQYKCTSFFKAIEIAKKVLTLDFNKKVLILTGEIAYTPGLRVVPRTTVVGDAATATLLSYGGNNHELLSVVTHFLSGYSAGIYLSHDDWVAFDAVFIDMMVKVVNMALEKALLTINKIKLILPHNVNMPTWKKIAAALLVPFNTVYSDNIPKFSHCFCSDHIINLESAIAEKRLEKGDYYLMAACGMGFYFSAAVFRY